MGLLDQNMLPNEYYSNSDYWGKYQFTSLADIISGFMIAYIGENKLISKVNKSDVIFHAKRALQEFSFDVFKSCKTIELEIPASLTMILPPDYVNYVKLTWSDSAGIEHIIYPTSKTSNPIAIVQGDSGEVQENLITNGGFDIDMGSWDTNTNSATSQYTGQANVGGVSYVWETSSSPYELGYIVADAGRWKKLYQRVDIDAGKTYRVTYTISDPPGGTMSGSVSPYILSTTAAGDTTYYNSGSSHTTPGTYTDDIRLINQSTSTSTNSWAYDFALNYGNFFFHSNNSNYINFHARIDSVSLYDTTLTTQSQSDTWSNYSSGTPSENQDDYQDDTYWPAGGERYGLDPQHAQANGSFFMDCNTGLIHFSSNISGRTVILEYISDSLGTDEEMQVHKLAEEAVYKWIAYAILSTRSNIPEYIVRRLKKERFAETRKAKLRLSNIKLEEITQILRGKSKQIKH